MIVYSNEKLSNEKQVSNIFYKLYENDLIIEEIFYDWYEKVNCVKRKFHLNLFI
jgi:hypothetical protein